MFLVLARYMNDDLPVALFTTRDAAVAYTAKFERYSVDKIADLLSIDVGEPISAYVIEFATGARLDEGEYVPFAADKTRDFIDEDEKANA